MDEPTGVDDTAELSVADRAANVERLQRWTTNVGFAWMTVNTLLLMVAVSVLMVLVVRDSNRSDDDRELLGTVASLVERVDAVLGEVKTQGEKTGRDVEDHFTLDQDSNRLLRDLTGEPQTEAPRRTPPPTPPATTTTTGYAPPAATVCDGPPGQCKPKKERTK